MTKINNNSNINKKLKSSASTVLKGIGITGVIALVSFLSMIFEKKEANAAWKIKEYLPRQMKQEKETLSLKIEQSNIRSILKEMKADIKADLTEIKKLVREN